MSSTTQVFYWIRKKRWKKKKDIYQRAFQLAFDKTLAFYVGIMVVVFLLLLQDWVKRFIPLMNTWENSLLEWLWLLPSILVIRTLGRSFIDPGLPFTSAELKLSLLPHSRSKILLLLAAEKFALHLLVAFALAALLGGLTPLSLYMLLSAAFIYSVFIALLTPIQWKLYSARKRVKTGLLAVVIVLLGASGIWIHQLNLAQYSTAIILTFLLMLAQFYFIPACTQNINWMKVVERNDAKVWNVTFVSQMTNITIKPPKRYGLVSNYLRERRAIRPITKVKSLYHMLWRSHLKESSGYAWKTLLIGVIVIIAPSLRAEWVMYVSVPVVLFVYIEVAAGIFSSHFTENPIFYSLPIDEKGWTSTYVSWGIAGLVPLLLSFLTINIILGSSFSVVFVQLAGVMSWSLYDMRTQLTNRMRLLHKENFQVSDTFRAAGYIILGGGIYFTPLLLALAALLSYSAIKRKRFIY